MGKRERDKLETELKKLHTMRDDGPKFAKQNKKVADAEKDVNLAENAWVRGKVG